MSTKGRVFSGARPTGRQHLGNYLGAIKNYVDLQEDYDCIYCIVDLHAMTTLEELHNIKPNTAEMALDWLAAGLRPEETILFAQSHVPQVTELHTILSMFTQLGKLTDLPTFKDKVRLQPHNVNYGLVGYPVLMTADITLYKADIVPVGIDQLVWNAHRIYGEKRWPKLIDGFEIIYSSDVSCWGMENFEDVFTFDSQGGRQPVIVLKNIKN